MRTGAFLEIGDEARWSVMWATETVISDQWAHSHILIRVINVVFHALIFVLLCSLCVGLGKVNVYYVKGRNLPLFSLLINPWVIFSWLINWLFGL